jgi:hypothetical protein
MAANVVRITMLWDGLVPGELEADAWKALVKEHGIVWKELRIDIANEPLVGLAVRGVTLDPRIEGGMEVGLHILELSRWVPRLVCRDKCR